MRHTGTKLFPAILAAMAAIPAITQAHAAGAIPALTGIDTVEAPRVTRPVDAKAIAAIPKTHLAMLEHQAATGPIPDSTPMSHIQIVLKRSAKRQAALDQLIAAQHNPHSAKFRQWLTPEEYGENFGVADADVAAVNSWLANQGITVNGVYPNRMQIEASGTAGAMQRAFHMQERQFTFAGAIHFANTGDISVPAALHEVIAGVAGLNDLRPQAQNTGLGVAGVDPTTHQLHRIGLASGGPVAGKPQIVSQKGMRLLVPSDMATMYGFDSLHARGITGKGITIAVVDDQMMVASDWSDFVGHFKLARYGGTFVQIQPQVFTRDRLNCLYPGRPTARREDIETVLDAEWATAVAPSAHVEVAACGDAMAHTFWDGIYVAANNLINGRDRPDIISVSYAFGEKYIDAGSKAATDAMWEQADAERISVFIPSGDSGSNPSFNGRFIMYNGIDANSLGTSPHVTVLGGTDTADVLDHTTGQYFKGGHAISYVPEIPWNESCGNPVAAATYGGVLVFCDEQLQANFQSITSEAGSGGPSSINRKPAWQALVNGAAADDWRDLPDVSLFAGSFGDATWAMICTAEQPCNQPGGPFAYTGGTSLASPMFAGIQALIDQGLGDQGLPKDQGNSAPALYALAAKEYGGPAGPAPATLALCDADNGASGTSGCVFHNVTRGGISTECFQQVPDMLTSHCYFFYGDAFDNQPQVGLTSTNAKLYNTNTIAYSAHPGWSFASGLGSVNAANLLTAWQDYANGR